MRSSECNQFSEFVTASWPSGVGGQPPPVGFDSCKGRIEASIGRRGRIPKFRASSRGQQVVGQGRRPSRVVSRNEWAGACSGSDRSWTQLEGAAGPRRRRALHDGALEVCIPSQSYKRSTAQHATQVCSQLVLGHHPCLSATKSGLWLLRTAIQMRDHRRHQ